MRYINTKKATVLALILLFALALSVGCGKESFSSKWLKTMEEGKDAATEQNKPLLVYYSADWNELSEEFEDTVLTDPDVRTELDAYVMVHIDSDVDADTPASYGVSAYPTCIFYRSDGEEITRVIGLVPPDEFAETLKLVKSGDLETFREFLAREGGAPGDMDLAMEVGNAYLDRTNVPEARKRYDKILRNDPENETGLVPQVILQLGFCDLMSNDPSGAIDRFERVRAEYPETDEARKALLYIGDCYRVMDDLEGALDTYEQVVADYPGTEEAETAEDNIGQMTALEETIDSLFGRSGE
ncbi:MAG: tetratricopeptide repeat protein [Candidatus Coatesbacteria bacterium]|nr:MAG: tetratricopeptide repeat protein [Candidatus Coatesbacteria bacterium]